MEQHGMAPQKFNYIPSGIDISEWNSDEYIPEDHKSLISKLKSEGRIVVGYTGSIGLANALDSLVESAKILKDEKISFIVVGNGPERPKLIKLVSDYQLSNFFFLNLIQKESIPSLLSQFDIVYIGLMRQPLFRFGISPNKLIDYMMAAKPVVQAIDSGNNLVEESGCGISAESENPESIANAIRKLVYSDKEVLEEFGRNGRKYILLNHNYESLSAKFINILES
jgi:glycosyltransferase involved in cell wall biosynthesis